MFSKSTFLVTLILFALAGAVAAQETIIPFGASWKYLDNGSNQGTAWRNPGFSDATWATGPAELGYGDGDEATVLSFGPNPSAKYITYYFRGTFNVSDPDSVSNLLLRLKQDDGAVVYVNGVEVFRSNMPTGTITYTTRAASCSGGSFAETSLDSSALVSGTNLVAVEMHQCNPTNADLSFDLRLTGTISTGITITRGPYLQLAGANDITVRWRTNIPTNSRVYYSKNPANQDLFFDNATATTEHSVRMIGLSGNTQYWYKVGTTNESISERFSFTMPPERGHPLFTRFWFLGDSGRSSSSATNVRNGYLDFTGTTYTGLMLFLGDNAYNEGTDSEYQSRLFNVFGTQLAETSSVSALGERDTDGASNPPPSLPYFNIFDLFANKEAGGWKSGTEKYYSFDFGTIHFIALDSMASNRTVGGAQLTWLEQDLIRNKRPWIIAYWHHSPYSDGNHNSDLETEMSEMRSNANEILEEYGVDLVLSAHSNSYERTFLIDGHYGSSSTFDNSMIVDGGDGRGDGDGEYLKPSGSTNSGAVYAVVGSSGGGVNAPLDYPAMFTSSSQAGSLNVDIQCTKMDVRFISTSGSIVDYFTIRKGNLPPTINISSPPNGASFTRPTTITITANANDPDTNIRRVRFFRNAVHIATDYSAPYSVTWSPTSAGTYNLTAVVEEELCASVTSAPVQIIVN